MKHTLLFILFAFIFSACSGNKTALNTLSKKEQDSGWKLLFDGTSTNGWHTYLGQGTRGWAVRDGELIALGEAGHEGSSNDIVTDQEYENFELVLEWKISKAGNSGIFFNVVEDRKYGAVYLTGPEYQLIDNKDFPDKLEEWQKAGANYAMHPASKDVTKPVGEWNLTKIVVNRGKVEHWLNGEKVVSYEMWTPEWERLVTEGKWKNAKGYGRAKKGKIGLQDHGNQIWFRNVKVRVL